MPETLQIITDDPWLEPYRHDLNQRLDFFQQKYNDIVDQFGSLPEYANRHHYLGFNYSKKEKGWWYREWAPAAGQLWLIGDFNDWNPQSHPLQRDQKGIWEIFIADDEKPLHHKDRVKVKVQAGEKTRDRIPAYIQRAVQDPETYDFSGQIWKPEKPFRWADKTFKLSLDQPVIYEAHVGMAQEKEGVGTYREFADHILPRIKENGYNCVQLMAIHEHPYYGSYGYHVSNFFAPSSRFGTPDELRYLVNKAHGLGLAVIMDVVHSHAVKNIAEGLCDFDGSKHQYFLDGDRGYHEGWDSVLFDYAKEEVLRFLLSNVHYWLEDFHFDGFRFDGVTSMMYHHHGNTSFDHYDKYFKDKVDWDAVRYLQLANRLAHEVKPAAITIAEDMSGMPGIARKVEEGGIGFDYRLGMGIPDYWIKVLKHSRDEDWNMHEMWGVLTNRRWKEKTIAYTESHDQALVGDKTLAFWLMDKEMYWHMSKSDENLIIDRGIALHKMLRLFSAALGGEGYLNFMGNEFGHPEWVDFPREGNNWSHKHARRQWSLVDNANLRYEELGNFDKAMVKLLLKYNILKALPACQLHMDEYNKILIFERNNLIFIFNFHPHKSIADYKFRAHKHGKYKALLISDDTQFGGHQRVTHNNEYFTDNEGKLSVYIPTRTAIVLGLA